MNAARAGFSSFEARAREAARTLLRNQGHDGGWGLTLTSVSSIVNTSEVLPVLNVAGVAGQPMRDAVGFLTAAIAGHCRPRPKGGRGEHTRFVAFGLAGLLSQPRFFHQDGVAETMAWCVGWLEHHQVDHGWPEVSGLDDTSLHQTAVVVHALAQLRDALHELGPGLRLADGIGTSSLLERAEPLIMHGVRGLLYHRRPSGAWGWRTYVDTEPSPSKTALCLLAFCAVVDGTGPSGEPAYRDVPVETGGVHGQVQMKRLSEAITEAGQWLLRNHPRWETFVEDDKDVQGTAWEHMAYALCTQAAIRSGVNPRDKRLAKAWGLMNDLWDAEAGMWNEPGASGKRATIRAAYYTVSAYREARRSLARLGLHEDDERAVADDIAEVRIISTVLGPERTLLLTTPDRDAPVECVLSERLFDLVQAVHAGPGQGLTTGAIANALFVAPSSVPKYVQRLNQAVSSAFGGVSLRVLIAGSVEGGSGYRLAGREEPT